MALTPEIKAQLNQYLVNLKSNVVIEAFVDESESSTNMSELLIELAEMSEKIVLHVKMNLSTKFYLHSEW